MRWEVILICIICGAIFLFPCFIYLISKAQMLGWLTGLNQFFEQEVKKHGKKKPEEK